MGVNFDEALQAVGSFGRWQRRVVLVSSTFYIPNAFALLLIIFACIDPISNRSWTCVDPDDATCKAVWLSNNPKDGFCSLPTSSWAWTNTDSLIAHFDLVCGDAWKVQLLNSFMFAGAFLGSGFFGWMSDRYGRKLPLFTATGITAGLLFATSAAPNYAFLAVMRALTGCASAGQNQLFLVCTEVTGPKHRGTAGIATLVIFTVGEFLLCAVAYTLPNWRHLTLVAAAINTAALFLYPLVPESPRWLLSRGRYQEAAHILRNISISNGFNLPTDPLMCSTGKTSSAGDLHKQGHSSTAASVMVQCVVDTSSDASSEASTQADSQDQTVSILQFFKVPALAVMFLVLVVAWFGQFLGYYGIALGSGALPGSIYVSFTLGTAAELAAILVAGCLVDKAGRHNVVSIGMLVGGAACMVCAMITGQTEVAVLAAIGKFGISAAMAVCPIFSSELFPTVVRATALGLLHQVGRCGSLAAPFLLMLGAQLGLRSAIFLPMLVFGAMALLGGALVVFLPETKGMDMPETLKDLNKLQTVFSAKPWSHGFWSTIKFLFRRSATAEESPAFSCSVDDIVAHQLNQAEKGCHAQKDTDCVQTDEASCYAADVTSLQANCHNDICDTVCNCAIKCKQLSPAGSDDTDQQSEKSIHALGLQIQVIMTTAGDNPQAAHGGPK